MRWYASWCTAATNTQTTTNHRDKGRIYCPTSAMKLLSQVSLSSCPAPAPSSQEGSAPSAALTAPASKGRSRPRARPAAEAALEALGVERVAHSTGHTMIGLMG